MTSQYDPRAIELLMKKKLIVHNEQSYTLSRLFYSMYSVMTMGTSLSEIEESQRMPYFKTTVKDTLGQIRSLSEEDRELMTDCIVDILISSYTE